MGDRLEEYKLNKQINNGRGMEEKENEKIEWKKNVKIKK